MHPENAGFTWPEQLSFMTPMEDLYFAWKQAHALIPQKRSRLPDLYHQGTAEFWTAKVGLEHRVMIEPARLPIERWQQELSGHEAANLAWYWWELVQKFPQSVSADVDVTILEQLASGAKFPEDEYTPTQTERLLAMGQLDEAIEVWLVEPEGSLISTTSNVAYTAMQLNRSEEVRARYPEFKTKILQADYDDSPNIRLMWCFHWYWAARRIAKEHPEHIDDPEVLELVQSSQSWSILDSMVRLLVIRPQIRGSRFAQEVTRKVKTQVERLNRGDLGAEKAADVIEYVMDLKMIQDN